jgi:hypothetical protein
MLGSLLVGILLVVSFWPAGAQAEDPPVPMEHRGTIRGLQGSYISMVHRGGEYQFFANALGTNTVGLVLFAGTTPNAVGPGEVIAPNSLIDDLPTSSGQPDPTRMITRPVVRFSEKDQRYYAIVHVSRGYPPSNGRVYPALLISKTADPRKGWDYKGQFKGEPATLYGPTAAEWTSGMAFLLNDQPSGTIDHTHPLANRFVLYNDFGGRGLKLLYSSDGTEWFFYRDSEKKIVEIMPKSFEEDQVWIFSSAVQTPVGYFMYVSARWTDNGPAGHRFLYSKDGLTWKQIESKPQGPKNFSLAYDAEKNQLYVMPTTVGHLPYAKDLYVMTPKDF